MKKQNKKFLTKVFAVFGVFLSGTLLGIYLGLNTRTMIDEQSKNSTVITYSDITAQDNNLEMINLIGEPIYPAYPGGKIVQAIRLQSIIGKDGYVGRDPRYNVIFNISPEKLSFWDGGEKNQFWDGAWSNINDFGTPGREINGHLFHNMFHVEQYRYSAPGPQASLRVYRDYFGEPIDRGNPSHATVADRTRSIAIKQLWKQEFFLNNTPTIITAARLIEHGWLLHQNTNSTNVQVWFKGYKDPDWYYMTRTYGKDSPIKQFYDITDINGTKYKSYTYLSFILSQLKGPTKTQLSNEIGVFVPEYPTSFDAKINYNYVPSDSERENLIASEWWEEQLQKKTPILNIKIDNGIPHSFTNNSAYVTVDNRKGTIQFNIRLGTKIIIENPFSRGALNGKIRNYRAISENVIRTIPGFKQIKPTSLEPDIYLRSNSVLQPQYVTVDDIKRIILTEGGIHGDLPRGFNLDNIIISKIDRFNPNGEIRVKAKLNLYYDRYGNLQQNDNSSYTDIKIRGFASTSESKLPNPIKLNNRFLNLKGTLATNVSIEQIKEIIYDKIKEEKLIWQPFEGKTTNNLFPANFSKDDLIIENEDIVYLNKEGKISVQVRSKNYFDRNGQVSHVPTLLTTLTGARSVTIEGFQSVIPTRISTRPYELRSEQYQDLYPTDLSANLTILKFYLHSAYSNTLPQSFDPIKDIEFSNVVANNRTGELTADVTLNKYFDTSYNFRTSGWKPVRVVFRLANSLQSTSLPKTIDVRKSPNKEISMLKSKFAFEVNEPQLKTIVRDSLAPNVVPNYFTVNNLKFKEPPRYEGSQIKVKPILTLWVDNNGLIHQEPKEFPEITIFGFKGALETTFDEKFLSIAGPSNIFPSAFINNFVEIKNIVFQSLQNTKLRPNNIPTDFTIDNIAISHITHDNNAGTVSVDVVLNYYYDRDGNVATFGFEKQTITIGGFDRAPNPTSVVPSIQLQDVQDRLVQSFELREIKELIMNQIVQNPAPGFDISNIEIKKPDFVQSIYNYKTGSITFVPTLNLWLDNNLEINKTSKDFDVVTITGFKPTKPTIINTSEVDLGSFGLGKGYASDFASSIKDNIIPHVSELIQNKPDSFTDNDIIISKVITDDTKGTLSFSVALNNYYDETGMLRNDGFSPQDIVFSGFEQINGATTISPNIDLTPAELYSNIYPFQLNEYHVRNLILEHLQNKPGNMRLEDVYLFDSFTVDNFAGTITATPYIHKYYDNSGQVILSPLKMQPVQFFGFKRVLGETTLTKNPWEGEADILPENAIKDLTTIKQKVLEHLNHPTEKLMEDINHYIELRGLVYDNISGTVTFNIILKEIYNATGEIVSGEFDFGSITITGYKQSLGYTTIPSRIVAPDPNEYASSLDIEAVKKLIFAKVNNAPTELDINGVHIKNNNITVNNNLGILKVTPILDWSYDVYGNLISIPKEFGEVTIYGFRQSSKTEIPITTISANASGYEELVKMYPNELDNHLEWLKDIAKSLIINTPPGFSNENISISNIQPDNYTGSINFDVTLDSYFNNDGVIVDTGFIPVTISIIDLKSVKGVTSVLRVINISDSNDPKLQGKLPGDEAEITDDVIKGILKANFASLPEGAQISFKTPPIRNNLDGSISVIPIVSEYFNTNSSLVKIPKEFPEVRIIGWLTTLPTVLNQTEIPASTPVLPSVLAQDTKALQKYVFNNLVSKPPLMNDNDVIIDQNSILADNINGTLTFQFSLTKYYDRNGLQKDKDFTPIWVKLTRLLTTRPSQLVNAEIHCGEGNIAPTAGNYTDKQVTEKVASELGNIISTLPPTFDIEHDFEIKKITRDYVDGQIDVQFELKSYYNNSGEVVTNTGKKGKLFLVSLTGFKQTKPTTINDVRLFNETNTLAQTVADDESLLSVIIANNLTNIIQNAPDDLSMKDISWIVKEYDNVKGTIDLEIILSNYYNQNGEQILANIHNASPLRKIIQLKGFHNTAATVVTPTIDITGYEAMNASEITNSDLKSIILANTETIFKRLPSVTSLENGNLEVFRLGYDNIQGSIVVNITLKEYFNEEGILISPSDGTPLVEQVLIKGFKKVNATSISPQIIVPEQTNNLASLFATEDKLKELIYPQINDIFQNLPPEFVFNESLYINIINVNNITGEIQVEMALNHYINDVGTIVKTNNPHDYLYTNVTISGFKQVMATKILPEVKLKMASTDALTLSDQDLQKIIYQEKDQFFKNLPDEFNNTYLDVQILSVNHAQGIIYANVSLACYYDSNDELVVDRQQVYSAQVAISGFRTYLSANLSQSNMIAIITAAVLLTILFVIALAISFKINKRRLS